MLKNPIFRFFASLKLAVVVMLALSGTLAAATILESMYGMRGAHLLVYGTPWFAGILVLLGTNVLCAALSRYPWKKHQTGFVITHLGIITLLFGSFLTQRFGVDGNLPVLEGTQDQTVVLNDQVLTVLDATQKPLARIRFPESALRREGRLLDLDLGGGRHLVAEEYLPRAMFQRAFEKSPVAGVGLPALRLELFNTRFNVEEWLHPTHPDRPLEVSVGPAKISYVKLWRAEDEKSFFAPPRQAGVDKRGRVAGTWRNEPFEISVSEAMKTWTPLGATGLKARVEQYLPYAVVENNELVNKSDEPKNPAVTLVVRDPKGVEEKHTLFAHFPEFATLHRRARKNPDAPEFGVQMRFLAGTGESADEGVRGKLYFAHTVDGRLLYRITGKGGKSYGQGEAKIGEPVPTGWMDLQFKIHEWYPNAVEVERPTYIEEISGGDSNHASAVKLRTPDGTSTWISEGAMRSISVAGTTVYVGLNKERLTLPFSLYLDKFTIGMNPGTQKAGSYESSVRVMDPGKPSGPPAVISMNEPLKYGGYTFYQASYQLEEGRAPVSVFSVNYDPGRMVKYLGSLLMVLGALVMFYFNPHYWGKIMGRQS